MMTDPIADLLTRVRNACMAGHRKVDIPSSKMKREIARILKERGFIHNFAHVDDNRQGYLRLYLKYTEEESSSIQGLAVRPPGRGSIARINSLSRNPLPWLFNRTELTPYR